MKAIDFIGIIIITFLLGILAGIIFLNDFVYKKGQVDCINGVINYQLVTNPDKSTSWEKK